MLPIAHTMRRALTAIACAAALVGVMPARAGSLRCIKQCDLGKKSNTNCCSAAYHPEIATVCDGYNACRRSAVTAFELCVANPSHCSPKEAGRCTLKLETCVLPCRKTYSKALSACRGNLKTTARQPCGTADLRSRRNVDALARACGTCLADDNKIGRPRVPFRKGDLDPEHCQEQCIARIPTVAGCNHRCEENCNGDRFALSICRRACRNLGCPRYASLCAGSGPKVDRAYLRCCAREDSECSDEVRGCSGG